MTKPTPADEAHAALWQRDGEDIAGIIAGMIASVSEREGRAPQRTDYSEGIGVLLAAAWNFAKLADANPDGRRGQRYAELLRRHADSVERLG